MEGAIDPSHQQHGGGGSYNFYMRSDGSDEPVEELEEKDKEKGSEIRDIYVAADKNPGPMTNYAKLPAFQQLRAQKQTPYVRNSTSE